MNDQPKTIAEVEALAAKVGITLTPDDYAAAQALADQRRQQIEREIEQSELSRSKTSQWVDQFNRWYPKFLKSLHAIGDVFITLTHTILIAFGVPAVLAVFMVVEQGRVSHGIKLFDATEALAILGAWAVVIANLLLELLISWREHQSGWTAPPQYDFSFRLVAMRLRYMFGQTTDWQPAPKSPAQRFKAVLRIITFAILALALAGSMRAVLEQSSGDWYAALGRIILHSTLSEIVTWIGGLLFAFAVVMTAQVLSHFVAERVVEIVAVMQSTGSDRDIRALEAAGLTGAAALLARLKEHQKSRRSGLAMASAMDMPNIASGVIRVPGVSGTGWHSTDSGKGGASGSGVPERSETSELKLSPAVKKTIKWLAENDPDHALSIRAAAQSAGVSPTTMQRARAERKAAQDRAIEADYLN